MKSLIARIMGLRIVPAKSTDLVPTMRDAHLPSVVTVGAEIPVGEFFWIDTCIGMADNAMHGHGVRNEPSPGSADEYCKVRVLDVKGDCATVVLLRPSVPYGAPAPHGTIFLVPTEVLEQWPKMTAHRQQQEQARVIMRRNLGSVKI